MTMGLFGEFELAKIDRGSTSDLAVMKNLTLLMPGLMDWALPQAWQLARKANAYHESVSGAFHHAG
jgi:hypothetical protein